MFKKMFVLLAAVLFVSVAQSKGSPPPPEVPTSTVIPIEFAQRAIHWSPERVRQTTNAVIQICPFEFTTTNSWQSKQCFDNNDKAQSPKWIFMNDYKVEGYELSAFQYVFIGNSGYRHLVMYFRKK